LFHQGNKKNDGIKNCTEKCARMHKIMCIVPAGNDFNDHSRWQIVDAKNPNPPSEPHGSVRFQKFLDRLRRIIYPFLFMGWNTF